MWDSKRKENEGLVTSQHSQKNAVENKRITHTWLTHKISQTMWLTKIKKKLAVSLQHFLTPSQSKRSMP